MSRVATVLRCWAGLSTYRDSQRQLFLGGGVMDVVDRAEIHYARENVERPLTGATGFCSGVPATCGSLDRRPSEVVLQADDVVLTEVVAVLDLDEDQVLATRVLDPVCGAEGDVDRASRPDADADTVEGDDAVALEDEPMLGPTVVHLVAEALPGKDHDALHLVAGALVQDGVPAPGPGVGLHRHRPTVVDAASGRQ